jgi:heme-degrading monooxygenase HmoA
MIASTPTPPYFAVIFTSIRTGNEAGYGEAARQMAVLATEQPGFLGMESARQDIGITISYWNSLEDIRQWKEQAEHLAAQERGKSDWYQSYRIRICKVEREYGI